MLDISQSDWLFPIQEYLFVFPSLWQLSSTMQLTMLLHFYSKNKHTIGERSTNNHFFGFLVFMSLAKLNHILLYSKCNIFKMSRLCACLNILFYGRIWHFQDEQTFHSFSSHIQSFFAGYWFSFLSLLTPDQEPPLLPPTCHGGGWVVENLGFCKGLGHLKPSFLDEINIKSTVSIIVCTKF